MLHDAPPELIVDDDDGFFNLNLGLMSIERTAARGLLVHARARHGDTMLGFAIIFDPDWEDEPIDADTGSFFWGTGTLLRTGRESDAFISLLRDLYAVPVDLRPMRARNPVDVVGLLDDPSLLETRRTHTKLFLDIGDEDSDAQVFLNIDPAAARVEFHEKDMDFRTPLLEALMEPRDPAKRV